MLIWFLGICVTRKPSRVGLAGNLVTVLSVIRYSPASCNPFDNCMDREVSARITSNQACRELPSVSERDCNLLVTSNSVISRNDHAIPPNYAASRHARTCVDGDDTGTDSFHGLRQTLRKRQ